MPSPDRSRRLFQIPSAAKPPKRADEAARGKTRPAAKQRIFALTEDPAEEAAALPASSPAQEESAPKPKSSARAARKSSADDARQKPAPRRREKKRGPASPSAWGSFVRLGFVFALLGLLGVFHVHLRLRLADLKAQRLELQNRYRQLEQEVIRLRCENVALIDWDRLRDHAENDLQMVDYTDDAQKQEREQEQQPEQEQPQQKPEPAKPQIGL